MRGESSLAGSYARQSARSGNFLFIFARMRDEYVFFYRARIYSSREPGRAVLISARQGGGRIRT